MGNFGGFSGVLAIILFVIFFVFVVNAENNVLTLKTNISEAFTRFEVQNSFDAGNITKGFSTPVSSSTKVYINNTGDTDIVITAELVDLNTALGKYVYLSSTTTDSSFRNLTYFSMNISKPSEYQGVNSDYLYAKIDLTSFDGNFSNILGGHEIQIRFIAMASS